jgi:sugar (pentulose or hexulose) kinase
LTLAVFDLGKTNSKLFVFDSDGNIIAQSRTSQHYRQFNGLRVLDDEALFAWMNTALGAAIADHDVTGVMFSGHGCTFALVDGKALTHPILDYEQEPPADISARIDTQIPPFAETFSPRLPLGFNYGRHMLWLAQIAPQSLDNATAILGYPQFWSWKFSGRAVSEVSYIGCHSHLWAPLAHDFSSLVDAQDWRMQFPAFARSGTVLGQYEATLPSGEIRTMAVHNGVHDSNGALYIYRSLGFDDFTLVSTGTWVIIFNPDCPLDALDEQKDMLANVSVDGEPVPTIRFMGGREFDIISDGWNEPVSFDAISAVIDKAIFALPSFAPGGPAPETAGIIAGPNPTPPERAAAAMLYVALMTDLSLDAIASRNAIIVDGGLTRNGTLVALLTQLRPHQKILQSANTEGSATGAAALAFEVHGIKPFTELPQPVAEVRINGLSAYRDTWRAKMQERLDAQVKKPEQVS